MTPLKVRVRDNADLTAKCRCGRTFSKVMVCDYEKTQRWFPFFCEKCDVR